VSSTDADEVRRSALDVVMTWGPEMARPVEERLLERHPDLDDATVIAALVEARQVTSKAEQLATAEKGVGESPLTRADIVQDHPWVSDELLAKAIQQGLYSHWRDTGL
jgi:trehalose utilization protein